MKRRLKKEELGYIAGILDGEGSISLKRQRSIGRRCFGTFIQVTSTNQDILYFLKRKLGGGVYNHSHKYSINHNLKKSWVWHLRQHREIESLLKKLLPYLIIKKKHALLMLKYIKMHWYGTLNAHDVWKYPKRLMKKELKIFLKLWDLNARGAKMRKPPIPEAKYFKNLLHRCRLCKREIRETKIKKAYVDITLCYKCNIKIYGHKVYHYYKRKDE